MLASDLYRSSETVVHEIKGRAQYESRLRSYRFQQTTTQNELKLLDKTSCIIFRQAPLIV
jgi:hypothetical protein